MNGPFNDRGRGEAHRMMAPAGVFRLAISAVTDPSGTASRLLAPGSGYSGPLAVYTASSAAYALLLLIRPDGFPAELAEAAAEFSGRSFPWLFTVHAASGLAMTAAASAMLPFFALFMASKRRIALSALYALAACGALAAAAFIFRGSPAASLAMLLALAAAAWRPAAAAGPRAAAFFRFALAVSAAELICLPAAFLAVGLRSEELFIVAVSFSAVWTLYLTVAAARALFGGTAVRAALALLLSAAAAWVSFYALKNLGVLPPDIFRFAMFM